VLPLERPDPGLALAAPITEMESEIKASVFVLLAV
jgi:hypothetical protein